MMPGTVLLLKACAAVGGLRAAEQAPGFQQHGQSGPKGDVSLPPEQRSDKPMLTHRHKHWMQFQIGMALFLKPQGILASKLNRNSLVFLPVLHCILKAVSIRAG